MGLYEASPTKRGQNRANLYAGTPKGRASENSGINSPVKAKRFSHQMPSLKGAGESMTAQPKNKDFKH